MNRYLAGAGVAAILLANATAIAAERTVTLTLGNLFCASCPYIVERTLARVDGVKKADVSFRDKTAVVTFDDGKTNVANVAALTAATADIGFPSTVVE